MRFVAKAVHTAETRRLLAGASLVTLAFAGAPALADDAVAKSTAVEAAPASAADAPAAPADAATSAPDKAPIVVTGSRVVTTGMDSPVPVTAVAAAQLDAMDPTSLIASISQLPQFYANQTPNNSAFFTRSGTGTLNLRGLGVNRTLTCSTAGASLPPARSAASTSTYSPKR